MKQDKFQDEVLKHLGADGEWKKHIGKELTEMKEQMKITNGTVKKHSNWISNFNGKIAIIGAGVVFGANILWQIIKDNILG